MIEQLPTAPVLLIVFNRPDATRKVLEAVGRASPSKLFVAADGPRGGNPADVDLCSRTLDVIREGTSWKCDVLYLIRDKILAAAGRRQARSRGSSTTCRKALSSKTTAIPQMLFFRSAPHSWRDIGTSRG